MGKKLICTRSSKSPQQRSEGPRLFQWLPRHQTTKLEAKGDGSGRISFSAGIAEGSNRWARCVRHFRDWPSNSNRVARNLEHEAHIPHRSGWVDRDIGIRRPLSAVSKPETGQAAPHTKLAQPHRALSRSSLTSRMRARRSTVGGMVGSHRTIIVLWQSQEQGGAADGKPTESRNSEVAPFVRAAVRWPAGYESIQATSSYLPIFSPPGSLGEAATSSSHIRLGRSGFDALVQNLCPAHIPPLPLFISSPFPAFPAPVKRRRGHLRDFFE